jgi:hypothetical protein
MQATRPKSVYGSLDSDKKEIRLLHLEPGLDETPITGSLTVHPLSSRMIPDYEAVSYLWGDSRDYSSVQINSRAALVPASAERALRGLRSREGIRVLWIDAVCIDQASSREREQQVAIMNDVYERAMRTVVWLGNDDETIPSLVASMQVILKQMSAETNNFEDEDKMMQGDRGDFYEDNYANLPTGCHERAIVAFYNRPWFQRLWVVQEVALSSNSICICGRFQIDWPDVARAAIWLYWRVPQKHGTSRLGCIGIDNATIMWQYYRKFHPSRQPALPGGNITRPTLGNLLANSRHFQATDARDKVFGLLGLTSWAAPGKSLPTAITPDYSLSLGALYSKATKLAIEETKELHILRYVLATSDKERNPESSLFPSWVPKWHRRAQPHHARPLPRHFNAHDGSAAVVSDNADSNVLTLKGHWIGRVSWVAPEFEEKHLRGDDLHRLFSLIHTRFEESMHCATPARLMQDLASILTAASEHGKSSAWRNDEQRDSFLRFLHTNGVRLTRTRHQRLLQQQAEEQSGTHSDDRVQQYAAVFASASLHRCFFITKEGYTGIGPKTMRQGDDVVVLLGGRTPYVLSPVNEIEGEFKFVGECYVRGLVSGQATKLGKPSTVFNLV